MTIVKQKRKTRSGIYSKNSNGIKNVNFGET